MLSDNPEGADLGERKGLDWDPGSLIHIRRRPL
jgi:hypothetical protein